jgi:tRNA U34 5-carboxymethylaminomethyl modifying GTPase MnmE/TrmE
VPARTSPSRGAKTPIQTARVTKYAYDELLGRIFSSFCIGK